MEELREIKAEAEEEEEVHLNPWPASRPFVQGNCRNQQPSTTCHQINANALDKSREKWTDSECKWK